MTSQQLSLTADTSALQQALQELTAWAGESPDRARKIREAFFRGDQLRPGIVSIEQAAAPGAGNPLLRIDLSHAGRELLRALTAGEGDYEIVQE